MIKRVLVTGGSGFLGSALVRRLVTDGRYRVRVFDNNLRGHIGRLEMVRDQIEFFQGDIRNPQAVAEATEGTDIVCHLAFINGTEFFYNMPELVLEVGVKGMWNVVDACLKHGVKELFLASSSEVYHEPPIIPTSETVPLSIPDPLNPRYSYAAGKLISEIIALNYGRTHLSRVVVFRPHNVYGPDMGWEHVIPQFVNRMKSACDSPEDPLPFPIQGDGTQTRSFVFVEDFVDGFLLLLEKGEHLNIYNIGTSEEISIQTLAQLIGDFFGRRVNVVPVPPAPGGTPRRCPDIRKISQLGYTPRCSLVEGIRITATWYLEHEKMAPAVPRREDPRWQLTNA